METPYLETLQRALNGNGRTSRNAKTRAMFSVQMRHDMRTGFPLLTTKSLPWKTILAELLWFIEGGRNSIIPFRMSHNRFRELLGVPVDGWTIWKKDAEHPNWVKKAKFPGDCGRIYGAQWRNWNGSVDQLQKLIERLKSDPESRYHKVVAWNAAETDDMCLPPCHGDFQCFVEFDRATDEKLLSLHMNQRSCDLFLGVPFNIASYGCLLTMLAQLTGCTAHELVLTLNDAHIYEQHVPQVETQLARQPRALPQLKVEPTVTSIDGFTAGHFEIANYDPHEAIKGAILF
jgi:thymidylate synthase